MLRPQRKAVRIIVRMNMNLAGGGMGEGQSRSLPWEKSGSGKRDGGDGSQSQPLLDKDSVWLLLRREKLGGGK